MARPRKEPHERRAASLPPVRLTDAELLSLGDQAAASGLTLSELVRQRLTTGRVTPRPRLYDAQLLTELNRVGVNLNQIAHHLNRGGSPPPELRQVLDILQRVLERVGAAYGA